MVWEKNFWPLSCTNTDDKKSRSLSDGKKSKMRISSPGTKNKIRETAFFSFSKKKTVSLIRDQKRLHFGGEHKASLGWSMHYFKYQYTIRSGLWVVIFSHFHSIVYLIQSSSSCLTRYLSSIFIGFGCFFNCSCPRWFRPAAVHLFVRQYWDNA